MFNAIGILLISLAIADAIFFSWLFYKIRQDERAARKSGCGCTKCKEKAAAAANGAPAAGPCAKCKEAAAKNATPCAKCQEAAAKRGTTATPCAKCQAAAVKQPEAGKSGCGCNKRK